ncbi:ATP-binding protein [Micromonospora zhanjiangensis]
MVEWSWELLAEEERTLARRLAVFADGGTLAAVERICGPTGRADIGTEDLVDLLAGLVDKSLVEDSGGRYRMLETIRAFGAEQLAGAGERDRLFRAHADYFLDLARAAGPHLRGAEQLSWLAGLTAEQANLTAALRWAVGAEPTLALRLVGALAGFWFMRGLRGTAAPSVVELLGRFGDGPPAGLTEEYVLSVLTVASVGHRDGEMTTHLKRVETILADYRRPPREPLLLVLWAQVTGPPPEAEMFRRRRLLGSDGWSRALGHFGWGFLHLYAGELTEAGEKLRSALADFRATGDRWGISQALDGLAGIATWRGDHATARVLGDEAVELAGQLGALEDLTELRCRRGERSAAAGDLAAARADFEAAEDLARRTGMPAMRALSAYGLGELARRAGDHATARRWHEAALACCPDDWVNSGTRTRILTALGRLAESAGDLPAARIWHHRALALALTSGNVPEIAAAAEGLAGPALLDADAERAGLLVGAARALRGDPTGGDPGGDSGGDPGGDSGGDPGGDSDGDPGGDSGGDPGGDSGGDPGGKPDPVCAAGTEAAGTRRYATGVARAAAMSRDAALTLLGEVLAGHRPPT